MKSTAELKWDAKQAQKKAREQAEKVKVAVFAALLVAAAVLVMATSCSR